MPTRPPTHGAQLRRQTDAARGTAAQRGYGGRWQRYREIFLAEHPLCVRCLKEDGGGRAFGGSAENPLVVDHIRPHKGDQKLFWDPENHQTLCKKHHDVKTATEDGGFGK